MNELTLENWKREVEGLVESYMNGSFSTPIHMIRAIDILLDLKEEEMKKASEGDRQYSVLINETIPAQGQWAMELFIESGFDINKFFSKLMTLITKYKG